MDLNQILMEALSQEASDVHIKVGSPPILRVNGILKPWNKLKPFAHNDVSKMAFGLMNEWQKERFIKDREVDMGYEVYGLGRFRVNVFQQRGKIRIALRIVPYQIKTLQELHLPPVIKDISLEQRGLILVTGTTGSGKSTTLASMIDIINNHRNCHIITVEDPIEFIYEDKKSIIDQREIGSDTSTFSSALRVALRQDPDVILVGEMRDLETIETVLTAAETGHLVMSTLHTLNATETITRIISVFPPYHQKQVRLQLAAMLKGVISQRLVPTADGMGRVPAVEVLISTARVRECIAEKDKTNEINDAIAKGQTAYRMQSFDQSLMFLMKEGLIAYEEALKHCTNPDDFALRVKGILATSDTTWEDYEVLEKEKEKTKEAGRRVSPERPLDLRGNERGEKG
ncbi:MAG: type IV pili twitching motility protein PilT [Deltaproteobacteria bacterium RBG_16_48_10]|nr:MAG: type IV pili twitching motility protein PilT [Deltaproteobacteria bacterium RBG_16_48_10]